MKFNFKQIIQISQSKVIDYFLTRLYLLDPPDWRKLGGIKGPAVEQLL